MDNECQFGSERQATLTSILCTAVWSFVTLSLVLFQSGLHTAFESAERARMLIAVTFAPRVTTESEFGLEKPDAGAICMCTLICPFVYSERVYGQLLLGLASVSAESAYMFRSWYSLMDKASVIIGSRLGAESKVVASLFRALNMSVMLRVLVSHEEVMFLVVNFTDLAPGFQLSILNL
jgi:hypothetical protein